jgi:hypothetical protein
MDQQPITSTPEQTSLPLAPKKKLLLLSPVVLLLIVFALGSVITLSLYLFLSPKQELARNKSLQNPYLLQRNPNNNVATMTSTPTPALDNASTLSAPEKVTTSDGGHYILYGQPAGQNNKQTKKIIFSLPGHGSTAEEDYAAWKEQLFANGTYALASINWWDGEGEMLSDYYTPQEVQREIQYFLTNQKYQDTDVVILEGFSRGSANTYPVVAYDVASQKGVIDGVISASGKYQSDFAMTPELLSQNNGKPFANISRILVCGEKDPSPTRDGCEGMRETQTFLEGKGANVLALLTDPNGGHGSFHKSPLKLAEKALGLFDTYFK